MVRKITVENRKKKRPRKQWMEVVIEKKVMMRACKTNTRVEMWLQAMANPSQQEKTLHPLLWEEKE